MMRRMLFTTVLLAGAGMIGAGTANAAPFAPGNAGKNASEVQKTQEFGIYIGPRYGYRDRYWDYGYGYYPNDYYGSRRYYYDDGNRYNRPYRWQRRPFKGLNRRAP